MQVNNFAEVISKLEEIVASAKTNGSPSGYFAALYLKMTIAVRDAVLRGEFENGSRMEQMDVNFARRYFDAYDAWQSGRPPTQSWNIAFEALENQSLTVMQHLILGMNAHINLDLCIAAASVRQRDAIYGLRGDFMKINQIIESLTNQTQSQLAKIWLPFGWLDQLFRTDDEGWIGFSITAARSASWKAAQLIAFAPDKATEMQIISGLDQGVVQIGLKVIAPGFWLNNLLRFMRYSEKGTVCEKIEALEQI